MSTDDDRTHPELVEREVECGIDRAIGRIGRYQVADVADGVQVTGSTGGDDVRHDPRVGTREEHRTRFDTVFKAILNASRRPGHLVDPGRVVSLRPIRMR